MKALFWFPVWCIVCSACRKEIDLDLPTESKIVIEALVNPKSQKILISRTIDAFKNTDRECVTGAQVYITNSLGQNIPFKHGYACEYSPDDNTDFTWEPGLTYKLNVLVDGQLYTAVSYMNEPAHLDSLSYARSPLSLSTDGGEGLIIKPVLKDQAGLRNYYRIKITNDSNLYLLNDNLVDGQQIHTEILTSFSYGRYQFVEVEVQSIDEATYQYFRQLYQNVFGQAGVAIPADPPTNIKGGALGYFSAYSYKIDAIMTE